MEQEQRHIPDTDRYIFDHSLMSFGYSQLDSTQDASWYGNWVNPHRLRWVEFAEGDITQTTFEDTSEFIGHLVSRKEVLGLLNIDDWQLEAAIPIEETELRLWFDLHRQKRQVNRPGADPEQRR